MFYIRLSMTELIYECILGFTRQATVVHCVHSSLSNQCMQPRPTPKPVCYFFLQATQVVLKIYRWGCCCCPPVRFETMLQHSSWVSIGLQLLKTCHLSLSPSSLGSARCTCSLCWN
ncbi:hypothetical protein HBI56_133870 [Parastagonospora nodorum]|uniref:Uncharacterized protein n=1 Tax=Phaeosphaeria nodorum (strain SN15 / ATCC MYA-4574 / FGSC 10173) TaxID=321614 RepID=A0A7U2F752_PHANO|nr:hypothetical protein HBH56_036970 [Parastagonospora nodorum]QRC99984.1 hypothetical protein JI435_069050 [Parastagonospora nodorum SN15]KAH3934038.1 hypothetical protein HBH54_062500 [Parastagonospora nodorum]KAH3952436.1 hypothetical protein HBH53_047620 [Parastagonospora nodorum]KAH3979595.1 hypothetical protein HBH51_058620 [Parastagonospora nodorum]